MHPPFRNDLVQIIWGIYISFQVVMETGSLTSAITPK